MSLTLSGENRRFNPPKRQQLARIGNFLDFDRLSICNLIENRPLLEGMMYPFFTRKQLWKRDTTDMHFLDIILKKRDGNTLSTEEIHFFINSCVSGKTADYQIAAMLMALWFQGMDERETADLTFAMRDSGETVNLSGISGIIADKHSTGGVADTTTLIAAPLAASCGVKIAKMSGRGLGHTGGTLDKLESIPGFSTRIPMSRFKKIVNNSGLAIIGQTKELVPADRILYALRDVTGTIDNKSLIAASIMSKKLAAGSDVIILDVKTGNGSFLHDYQAALDVAKLMVEIGKTAGKEVLALITDMNQPLGSGIGNALEVREAVEILQGRYAGPLADVALELAANMVLKAQLAGSIEDARNLIGGNIANGKGLESFATMIDAQGGNPEVIHDLDLLPMAAKTIELKAERSGFISHIETAQLGKAAQLLGAGRTRKEDAIDPAVGLWMKKRLGEKVQSGSPLAILHVNDEKELDQVKKLIQQAITISDQQVQPPPLIYTTIS